MVGFNKSTFFGSAPSAPSCQSDESLHKLCYLTFCYRQKGISYWKCELCGMILPDCFSLKYVVKSICEIIRYYFKGRG